MLSSYEAHICVEHLHQIRGDEAIKYNRSIVQSSKSGSGSILLYYESKSRCAQSSVQISINDSRRCNYAPKSYERDISGIAAKIGDRSCSPALVSINAEKTQPVKNQQATGNKTESNLDFLFVELLNCLEERHAEVGYKIYGNNLPSSSFMRDFCHNYKKWFIWYNCEHYYCKYVFFHKQTEREKRDSSIALVNRQIFQPTCCKESPTSVTIVLITFSTVSI